MSCKETMIHGVHVFGAHLLHPKMLEVIAYGLEVGVGNNLNAIFISPFGPANRLGDYDQFNRAVSISIPGIVKKASDISTQNSTMNGFSLTAICWQELIYTFFHELHHNIAFERDANLADSENWKDEEEASAHEYALEMTEDAIIRLKAEVPSMKEFMAFNEALEFLLNEKVDEDDEWPATQRGRIEEGIVFECETETYMSIIDYYLATCENPEKYDRQNEGAAVAMKVETPTLYDRGMPKSKEGGDLGSTLSAVKHAAETATTNEEGGAMGHEWNNAGGAASEEDMANAMDIDSQVIAEDTEDEDEDIGLPSEVESTPTPASMGTATLFAGATQAKTTPSAPATPPTQQSLFQQGGMATNSNPAPTAAKEVTPEQQMIRNVMIKLVEHALTVAGFTSQGFTNPDAIYNTPLMLTPEEKASGIFVGSKTITNPKTGDTGYGDIAATGYITGFVYKKSKVPAYELLMNLGGASCKIIRVIPQNPNKNSKSAARASAGERLGWIFHILDTNGPKDGETWEEYYKRSSEYIGAVKNGTYEALR